MPYLPHKTCCPDTVASAAAIPDEANCSWLHQSHHCDYCGRKTAMSLTAYNHFYHMYYYTNTFRYALPVVFITLCWYMIYAWWHDCTPCIVVCVTVCAYPFKYESKNEIMKYKKYFFIYIYMWNIDVQIWISTHRGSYVMWVQISSQHNKIFLHIHFLCEISMCKYEYEYLDTEVVT